MTSSRRWGYYRDGSNMCGIRIVNCEVQGTSQKKTIYNVVFDCCGMRKTMNHERILARLKIGQDMCCKCGKRKWRYYEPHSIVGGYEILERISVQGKEQTGTIYRAKAMCCGAEADVSHERITRRMIDGSILCPYCAKARREARAEAVKRCGDVDPKKRATHRVDHSLDLPRPPPSWVPIGVHVAWEDRMGQDWAQECR